jgi:hypothetical protein
MKSKAVFATDLHRQILDRNEPFAKAPKVVIPAGFKPESSL